MMSIIDFYVCYGLNIVDDEYFDISVCYGLKSVDDEY